MPLEPQRQLVQGNVIYMSVGSFGMTWDSEGNPMGMIHHLTLRGAVVEMVDDGNGGLRQKWSRADGEGTISGVTFGFNPDGSIREADLGDLAPVASLVGAVWAALVPAIGGMNAIRKLA